MQWSDGSFYEGTYKYGVRQGFGSMTCLDGREYKSYYRLDYSPISGEIMNNARGRKYIGMWYRDYKHGFGTEIDSNNNIKEGYFEADRL